MSLITWKDLLNLSDKDGLSQATKSVEQFEAAILKMVENVSGALEKLHVEQDQVKADAAKQLQQINNLSNSYGNYEKELLDAAKQSEKLLTQSQALKKVEDENTGTLKKLKDAADDLAKSKKKLSDANTSEEGSLDDLRKKLILTEKEYKALGDSADDSIKEKHLQKVKEAAAQYNAVNGSLTQAKKAAITAASSYNELSSRVAEATKKMKAMEGGLHGTSVEFQSLKKYVKDGNDQLKQWDEAVGVNTRKVGDYAGEIGKINPAFGGMIGNIKGATAAAEAFIATPLGMVLAIVAAGLAIVTASIGTFFTESIKGQDKLTELNGKWNGSLEITKNKLQAIGEGFVDLFTNPKKAFSDFGDYLVKWWTDFTKIASASWNVVKNLFSTNSVIEWGKVVAEVFKEEIEIMKQANIVAQLESKIRKEKIKDVVDDGVTEVKVNQLLEDSKDKLRFKDNQRFNALREANRLLKVQAEGDLELAQMDIDLQKARIRMQGGVISNNKLLSELTNEEIANIGVKYEEIEKLAAVEAAYLKVSADASTRRKSLLKQEIGFIKDAAKEYADDQKRRIEATRASAAIELNEIIATNDKVVADQDATSSEIYTALINSANARIDLIKTDESKALEIAKEAALDRIEISSEDAKAIYENKKLSLEQIIALERDAKERALSNDKEANAEYLAETDRISKEYANKIKATDDKLQVDLEKNIFTFLKKDFDDLNNNIAKNASIEQLALEDAYKAGNASLGEILKGRKDIQKRAIQDQLYAQLDYLQKESQAMQTFGHDTTDIDRKIADTRLAISKQTTDQMIANEQRFKQAVTNLQGEVLSTIVTFGDARFQNTITNLEKELAANEDMKNRRLAIVKDDAQAQAFIAADSAAKQKQIQKEIANEKRKQAIFQKAVDSAGVITSTAKGIATAVSESPLTFGLPWSGFMAITGALQLARILATPIPQYYTGVDSAPEGLAWVGDRGRELVVDPSGEMRVANKPELAYLAEGTKVYNNADTESIFKDAKKYGDAYFMDQMLNNDGLIEISRPGMDSQMIASEIQKSALQIVQAVQSAPHDVFDEKGYRIYEQSVAGRVVRLDKRYKL